MIPSRRRPDPTAPPPTLDPVHPSRALDLRGPPQTTITSSKSRCSSPSSKKQASNPTPWATGSWDHRSTTSPSLPIQACTQSQAPSLSSDVAQGPQHPPPHPPTSTCSWGWSRPAAAGCLGQQLVGLPRGLHVPPLVGIHRRFTVSFDHYLVADPPPFFLGFVCVANLYGILTRHRWATTTSLMAGVYMLSYLSAILVDMLGSGKATSRLLQLYTQCLMRAMTSTVPTYGVVTVVA